MRMYNTLYNDFLSILSGDVILAEELAEEMEIEPFKLSYYIKKAERNNIMFKREYRNGQLYSLKVQSWSLARLKIAAVFHGPNATARKRRHLNDRNFNSEGDNNES